MSTNSPETDDLAELSRRVEAIMQESASLSAAMTRVRLVRLVLFLGLIAIALITVYKFYALGDHLRSDENLNKLADAAEARLEKRNDAYMREVQQFVDHSSPVVSRAFYDQARKDLPDFVTDLSKERDVFTANLESQLSGKVDAHFARVQLQADRAIAEAFPEVSDEERKKRMVANIEIATQRLAKRYYLHEIEERLNGPDGIYANLDKFPAAAPAQKGDASLEDQLTGKLLDLLSYRLAHPDSNVH